ncbi:uncharacterized protein LOC131942771 [Physella acuta]|uniref:uncharacterized protein LOC131942771 n=1 Tax=Physella acuta TaxID=109671 RepID=UPI0027DE299A|nr:uncharacterized protein LOC131942771 [Physella acuta]
MTDNQEQHPDLKLTSHFLATNMTPTTDFKSPHEEVVTINEPVRSGRKNPTKITKLCFVFIVASGIINCHLFAILYNCYYKLLKPAFGETSSEDSEDSINDIIFFVFLCNNIACLFICLHIFTNRCRANKVIAVIATGVCIFTPFFLFAALALTSPEIQPIGLRKYALYYILLFAPYSVQFTTGLLMIIEMYNFT